MIVGEFDLEFKGEKLAIIDLKVGLINSEMGPSPPPPTLVLLRIF